jgi:hypothetical protein
MLARAVCLAVVMTFACGSPSSGIEQKASPTSSSQLYLGSVGSAGCKPAAVFKASRPWPGLPEAGLDSNRGSFWALFFQGVPPPAGKDLKVVWKMTGSGPFTFRMADADGKTVALDWGPDLHGGSNWDHPGGEVGTGFVLPHAGCWNIHVSRSDVAGDLWLEVAA